MIPLGVLASSYVTPAGGGELVHSFVASATNPTKSVTSWTFSDISLGDAAADRTILVVVGIRFGATSEVPDGGVTIGGIASTRIASYAYFSHVSIHALAVPSGTIADIVVAVDYSNNQGCTIGVYRIAGGPVSVQDAFTGSSPYEVEGVAGGFVIAASNTNATYSWTGDVVKDFEESSNGWRTSAASGATAVGGTYTATSNKNGLMASFAT